MTVPVVYANPNALLAAGGLEGATDDVISATYFNRIAACLHYLGGSGGYIAGRAVYSVTQAVATASSTQAIFGAENFDSDPNGAMHDNVTNNQRVTAKTAGLYHIKGYAEWAGNATGWRMLSIRLNGSTGLVADKRPAAGDASVLPMTISADYVLAANDYVELLLEQTSGGNLTVNAAALSLVKS